MARNLNQKNHITILPNKRKKLSKHPDFIGRLIDENGVQHDIALWKLDGKQGMFLSGRYGNSEENRKKYGKNKPKEENKPKSDIDDLPF